MVQEKTPKKCYILLIQEQEENYLVKTKSIVPKIPSLTSRQTKIQLDKIQIRSKNITHKTKKNKHRLKIPKFYPYGHTYCFSLSCSLPLSTLALCLYHSSPSLVTTLKSLLLVAPLSSNLIYFHTHN